MDSNGNLEISQPNPGPAEGSPTIHGLAFTVVY